MNSRLTYSFVFAIVHLGGDEGQQAIEGLLGVEEALLLLNMLVIEQSR
jgi:hypothetical protein